MVQEWDKLLSYLKKTFTRNRLMDDFWGAENGGDVAAGAPAAIEEDFRLSMPPSEIRRVF
jgi:hypothetical protein